MRVKFFSRRISALTGALAIVLFAGAVVDSAAMAQPAGAGQNSGRRERGMGGFPGGGRGILGSVTEVAADHYTLKADNGDIYTVHFSVNTRILKQPPGQAGQGRSRRETFSAAGDGEEGAERAQPQSIKPSDIKVGDVITAAGEVDAAAKSIGAVFILQIDPERAKQMREMQANYGKTWLAGRITSIKDTTIAIEGMIDHAPHAILVDENTSFKQRRDAITLADIEPGEQLRAEGAVKGGVFVATTVTVMRPQNRDEGAPGAAGPTGTGLGGTGLAGSAPKPQ
jgi:hypothetical protein